MAISGLKVSNCFRGESSTHLIENDTVLKYQLPQIGGGFTNPRMGDQDWFSRGVESKDYWIAKEGRC